MPGKFQHRKRAVVAKMLWTNRGLGTNPAPWAVSFAGKGTKPIGPSSLWPVFVGSEPSEPDNVITVYDTAPQFQAKMMPTGEEVYLWGITIRVRGRDDDVAGQKAEDIAFDLQRSCTDQQVTLTTPIQQYLIQSVPRATIVPFGKMTSPQGIGLWLVNVNCQMVILPYPIQG